MDDKGSMRSFLLLLIILCCAVAVAANVTVTKTTSTPIINDTDIVTFEINVTNVGATNLTNLTLFDLYNNTYLGSPAASMMWNASSTTGTESELEWLFNLLVGEFFYVEVNFTAQQPGNTTNDVEVENTTMDIVATNATNITILALPPEPSQSVNITVTPIPNPLNVTNNITLYVNVTNNGTFNLTDLTLFVSFNTTLLNYTTSTPVGEYDAGAMELNWTFNLTTEQSMSFIINATALQQSNVTVLAEIENSTQESLYEVNDTVEIFPEPMGQGQQVNVLKTSNPNPDQNTTITFTINITNNGMDNLTNLTLVDEFNTTYLNFTGTNYALDDADASDGNITWFFNLSANTTLTITVNFTTMLNGSTVNFAYLFNGTEQIENTNQSITISSPEGGGGNADYTAVWSQAQPARLMSTAPSLFTFPGAPYVARGDGCYRNPGYSENYDTPGQNCCSLKNNNGGDNCAADYVEYDLGAVWTERTGDLIAWRVAGSFSKQGQGSQNNISICDGINRSVAFVVEFDVDDNSSTGCDNGAGEGCYPGADAQIWFFPDSNESLYAYYNTSGPNVNGISFIADTNASANSTWVYYNCSATDNKKRGITIIVNKTAVNNSIPYYNGTLSLNFETNSFNTTEATTNPIDLLTDSAGVGQPYNAFLINGPSTDAGACYQWDNTNQSACESNSDSLNCVWTNLGNGGLCDPDFNSFSEGAACFTYANEGSCNADAQNIGYCQWQGDISLPNGSTGLCTETFKPSEFGGGNCDSDCFNCFSETQCSNSDANGGSEWGGCAWYNDTFNPGGWCDVKDVANGCSVTAADCFSSTECTNNGWNWNTTWGVCTQSSGVEICFNGVDDDADGTIDCDDTSCDKSRTCGGHINVLTGTYQGYDPELAMQQKLMQGAGPVLDLATDSISDGNGNATEILGFGVVVSDFGIGMGMTVANTSSLLACGGSINDSNYMFMIDNDADAATGCNITVDGSQKLGYEYMIKYGNYTEVNESGSELFFYACYNDAWVIKEAAVDAVMESGDPNGGPSEGPETPIECNSHDGAEGGFPVALLMEKADIGNPKEDIRFMGITVNGSYDNHSNLSSFDVIEDVYYTPGSMNFEPVDCFQEPTKCGAEFMVLGGGNFMPIEDCFGPGDEDADGDVNCADSDCSLQPQCVGSYNASADKTRPKVKTRTAKTFNDLAAIKWITNEPTNGSIKFYHNQSSCSDINATLVDIGDPTNIFDDFRPWHDMPIGQATLGYPLSTDTTYYYKILNIDRANNSAISKCLNFTTATQQTNLTLVFNFTSSTGNASDFLGNLSITVNNSDFGVGSENDIQGTLLDVNMTIKNPNADPESNWSITLVGVDISEESILDFSNGFVANSSGDQGDFIGMDHDNWLTLVQKLGADHIEMKIPSPGQVLYHCAENGTNCTDVSNTDGVQFLASDSQSSTWKVPTSLGFSSYSTEDNSTTYVLNYTNTTSTSLAAVVDANASVQITANNTMSTNQTYNFTLELPTNVSGTLNGSANISGVVLTPNGTVDLNVTVSANASGFYTFNVIATLSTNSSIILNSSDDLTLTLNATVAADTTAPIVSAIVNYSITDIAAIINWTTDENANSSVAYGTTTALGSQTINTTLATTHSIALSGLSPGSLYYYNITSCDASDNCNITGPYNFTTLADQSAPSATLTTPADGDIYATNTITLNFTLVDNLDSQINFTVFVDGAVNVTGTSTNNTQNITTSIWVADGADRTITVQASDGVGNAQNSTPINITVDTTDPIINITSPANNSLASATQQFTFNATDATDDNLTYQVYVNDVANISGAAINNTLTSFNLSLSEGTQNITIAITDDANNSVNATISVTVDASFPVVSSFTVNASTSVKSTATIRLNATITDSTALVTVNASGGAVVVLTNTSASSWNATTTPTALGCSEGNCTITLFATDTPGNLNNTETLSFTVDDTAPVIVAPAFDDAVVASNTTAVTLNMSVTDANNISSVTAANGSSVTLTASGSIYSVTTNATALGCTAPICIVQITATDEAGNSNTSANVTLIVDTVNPGVNITLPANGSIASGTQQLTINATDNYASTLSYIVYINGTENITGSATNNALTSFNVSLSEGSTTITVQVADDAGNAVNKTITLTVDTSYPTVSSVIVNATNAVKSSASIQINATISDATLATVTASNGSIIAMSNTSATSWNLTSTPSALGCSEGLCRIVINATDQASNTNNTENITITVDDTNPNVSVVLDDYYVGGVNDSVTITATVTETNNVTSVTAANSSSVTMSGSGSSFNITTNATALGCTVGTCLITLTATDEANNINNTVTVTLTVDTTDPTVNITTPLNNTFAATTVQITFNATDNFGPNVTYSILVNGTSNATGTATLNALTSANVTLNAGTNLIRVVVTDGSGNSVNDSITLLADTTAPAHSAIVVNNISITAGQTVLLNVSNGRVVINFTLTETNLSSSNITFQGVIVNTTTLNGSQAHFANLAAGKHQIRLIAGDVAGNTNAVTFYIKINRQVNTTAALAATSAALGSALNSVNLSIGSTDFSNNVTEVNRSLNLTYNINAGGTVLVSLPFNGLNANWNHTGNYSLDTNISGTQATNAANRGAQMRRMVLFRNFNRFLNNTDFTVVRLTFNSSIPTNESVFYIADDDGEDIYRLDQCSGNSAPASVATESAACFTNTSSNVTIHAPHLSGGGMGNDTKAPAISSVASSSLSTSGATISWTTDESADTNVTYGTSVTNLSSQSVSATDTTSHSRTLSSLSASTQYFYNVTSCDPSGNCNTTGPYNFTTSTASSGGGGGSGGSGSGGSGSGGSGSGGGGGGGGAFTTPMISTSGTRVTLTTFGRYTFMLADNSEHTIMVEELGDTQATFKFQSKPGTFTLTEGQSVGRDITGDSSDDVRVELVTINANSVYVELTRLVNSEPETETPTVQEDTADAQEDMQVIEEPQVEETPTESEPEQVQQPQDDEGPTTWPWVILITVLLLGGFVFWAYKTGRITID